MLASKIFTLALAGLLFTIFSVMIIKFIILKKRNEDSMLSSSFSIWFLFLFLSSTAIAYQVISVLQESIDIISKTLFGNIALVLIKISSLLAVTGLIWFIVALFITQFVSKIIFGNRKNEVELANNNVSFFVVKGAICLGFVLSTLTLLEFILRLMMPEISIPFYH